MSTLEDPQALLRLVGQFGQDFTYEFPTERAAYEEFQQGSTRTQMHGALEALDRLLATATTEAELERRLNALAFAYVVQVGGSASNRDFLLRLRGWLVESLEERPPTTTR